LALFVKKSRYPAHRTGHLDSKEASITLAHLDPAYKAGLTARILLAALLNLDKDIDVINWIM
jgi:hypothetical protein